MRLLFSLVLSAAALTPSFSAAGSSPESMTILPSRDFNASVSANGRYMAFVSDRSGNYDLWIKDMLESRFALPRQITKHPAPDLSPALNRDGTKLLYVSKKSDPRGDIYLLDRISGVETKLTGRRSDDSSPAWSPDEEAFYYLKYDYRLKERSIVKYSLETKRERTLLTGDIHSFCVQGDHRVIYSDGRKIISFRENGDGEERPLTDGDFIDILPAAAYGATALFFTRYHEDTDNDGRISINDAPSVWVITKPSPEKAGYGVFQVTADGQPSFNPEPSGKYLYFSDLLAGNILRIAPGLFFRSYESFEKAKALADSYRERGEESSALMVMGNISRNSIKPAKRGRWEEFNLEFARTLISQKKFATAANILKSLEGLGYAAKRVKEILLLESETLRKLSGLSASRRREIAREAAEEILRSGEGEYIYGNSLLEAGRVLLSANEQRYAIELLDRAEKTGIREIEARALFLKGEIYRKTGALSDLTDLFVDIMLKLGPESFWGKKAISDTISVSEKGETTEERLLSLRELSKKYPDLPSLTAASLFRQAYLLRSSGEDIAAIDKLDRIIKNYSSSNSLVERALIEKADIFSERESFNSSYKTYETLLSRIGEDHPDREFFEKRKLLQRVREGYRKRGEGEVRVAAKLFKMVITEHPGSVEGHRGYIETRIMLGEYRKLVKYYRELLRANPQNAVFEYALGLTLTYATPPELKEAIVHLERALQKNQSVTYFHQTLGWAYEQTEKLEKRRGYLEKAAGEYLAALRLNDALEFPDVEADLLLNTGNAWFSLGNFREALRFYRQRESLSRPFRSGTTEMLFRKNLGKTCFKTGDSRCAVKEFRKASELLEDENDNPALKAELFERAALAFQDLGEYAEAADLFSQALAVNLKLGNLKNVTLLRRNIGVNLYNESLKTGKVEKRSLSKALESYLASLSLIGKYGVNEERKGKGFINIDTGLGKNISSHARGFDRASEEKLLFGYIADTYERLSEPDKAIEYYKRKISGYPDGLSPEKNAAMLTEKGVTLNRLGVLYYNRGRLADSEKSLLASLKICLSLGLGHGVTVNILNLSRVLSKMLDEGKRPLPGRLLSFFNTARRHFSAGKGVKGDFQIFSSLARLAYSAFDPSESLKKGGESSGIRPGFINYSLLSDAIYYAERSLSAVKDDSSLSPGIKNNLLMFTGLNLFTILEESGLTGLAESVDTEIRERLADGKTPDAWVYRLFQAENAPGKERVELLREAADALLAIPPPVWSRGNTLRFLPLLNRLKIQLTELLLKEGRHREALSSLERLEERITASRLRRETGDEIFFMGMAEEFKRELRGLLKKIEISREAADLEKTEEYLSSFEESVFAIYDETPSAVSLLYHYDLPVSTLSKAIGPNGVYIRAFSGGNGPSLFLVSGNSVEHITPDELAGKISGLSPVYLSGPKRVKKKLETALTGKSVILVNSFYNILDARSHRTLFITRGAASAPFTLDGDLLDENFSTVVAPAVKNSETKRGLIKRSNFFAGITPLSGGVFLSVGKNGLHDRLPLSAISPDNAHTAFLMNLPESERELVPVWVELLLKTGFAHIVVNNSTYNAEVARKLISLYLSYSQDLPASEALTAASTDISEWLGRESSFSLYGYAGMEEEERLSFASEIYSKEIQNAAELFKKGRFENALTSFENALWLAETTGREEDLTQILKLLVEISFRSEEYPRAIRYQKKLLSRVPPENEEERAAETYTLGVLYSRIERYHDAIKMITGAVRFWKENDELDDLAKGVSTLGVIRENSGEYTEAFNDFLASSKLMVEIGENSNAASMLRKMGRINYLRLGRYEEARRDFLKAREIFRSNGDKKGVAETAFEVGFTFEKTGLFDNADAFYKEGRAIAEENGLNGLLARGRLYLANTRWFRGEYQEAFQYISEAGNIAEESDTPLQIMIENTKGLIYWTLNEPGKAVTHIKRAVKMAKREKMRAETATSLNNLGLVYRQTGDLDKSIKTFRKALKIDTELKSEWGRGYDLRNLGISVMRAGKYGEAEKLLIQAEKRSGEIKNRINQVKSLLELGNVNLLMKNTKKASAFFESAYNASTRYHLKEVSWRAAYQAGKIEERAGDTENALHWYETAVEIVETMRADLKIEELRNSFQTNKTSLYRDIITLLVRSGNSDSAFNYLERSRSRSFIDLLGNKKIEVKSPEEQRELDELNRLFLDIETVSRETGTYETPPPTLLARLEEAQNSYEEALIELKRKNPELSSFVSIDPLKIGRFREILDRDVTALSYMVTDNKVFIWLVRKEKTMFFQSRTKHLETEKLVKTYRRLVQNLKPVDRVLERLYEILIKPAENELDRNRPLLVIPDGPLHYLSFSALKKGDEYLVDRTPIFYTPSASVLEFTFAKREAAPSGEVNVLAVGNPDLGSYNYDLPMAEFEAESIKWNFPKVDLLTGEKATKKWIVSNIGNYNIIHIASHGEFNSRTPLLSALVFASEKGDTGRLTVQEIFSLNLKADIVTLSACQTGLGKLEGGELIGLNRSFIYAGTHSLISSLWRVDDLATALLMKHFYRNFTRLDTGESLRKAQLLVKKSFPHPAFWAGFSLVGDYKKREQRER